MSYEGSANLALEWTRTQQSSASRSNRGDLGHCQMSTVRMSRISLRCQPWAKTSFHRLTWRLPFCITGTTSLTFRVQSLHSETCLKFHPGLAGGLFGWREADQYCTWGAVILQSECHPNQATAIFGAVQLTLHKPECHTSAGWYWNTQTFSDQFKHEYSSAPVSSRSFLDLSLMQIGTCRYTRASALFSALYLTNSA